MAKPYVPEERFDELRQLVLEDPYLKLSNYRLMINAHFEVEYKRDGNISKLFKKAGIIETSEKSDDGEEKVRTKWIYDDPDKNIEEGDEEPSLDEKLEGLVRRKPIRQTKQIISIPTYVNCESRLCQKLNSIYKNSNIVYIPAYRNVCVVCNKGKILEEIFNDLTAIFE